jgi:hypothetical protein
MGSQTQSDRSFWLVLILAVLAMLALVSRPAS